MSHQDNLLSHDSHDQPEPMPVHTVLAAATFLATPIVALGIILLIIEVLKVA